MQEVKQEHLKDVMAVHLELADEHYHTCQQLGIALTDGAKPIYVPFDIVAKSDVLRLWLEDATKIKYMSDSKAAQAALRRAGIRLAGVDFDLLLASYINNPGLSGDDVATLAKELGYRDVQANETVYGKGAKRAIPTIDTLAEHASRKAFAVWSVQPKLETLLKENEQFDLYKNLELPLASILGEMESEGITVNRATLEKMGQELNDKLVIIEQEIYTEAGEAFNINSPKQLGVILFDKLGLPVIKKNENRLLNGSRCVRKIKIGACDY